MPRCCLAGLTWHVSPLIKILPSPSLSSHPQGPGLPSLLARCCLASALSKAALPFSTICKFHSTRSRQHFLCLLLATTASIGPNNGCCYSGIGGPGFAVVPSMLLAFLQFWPAISRCDGQSEAIWRQRRRRRINGRCLARRHWEILTSRWR
jgi:hypothetical protein